MSNKNKKYRNFKQQQPRNDYDELGAIKIERSGFPIKIKGSDNVVHEFFFDASEGHMQTFLEMMENPDAFVERVRSAETPVMNVETGKVPSASEFNEFINSRKYAMKILIDTVLGEGSFDRLYKIYPDLKAIANVYEAIIDTVGRGLEIYNKKEKQAQQRRRNELANYKASKRGN